MQSVFRVSAFLAICAVLSPSVTADPIDNEVMGVIAQELNLPSESILPLDDLKADLGADELDLVEIHQELEDVFGISISKQEFETCETVGDLVHVITDM